MKIAELTKPKTIFLDPKAILRAVHLRAGDHVVDLGCGGGYFVLEAARQVGSDGLVFGVDILPSALSAVASRARLYNLFNVRTVWSNAEVHGGAHQIPDHSIDTVLMVQLLSQTNKRRPIIHEATRMAKDHATLLVVDWRPGHGYRFGPSVVHCLDERNVVSLAAADGWQPVKTFAAGPYHFGTILQR